MASRLATTIPFEKNIWKAVGMLTGMAEDKVVEDCLAILEAKG